MRAAAADHPTLMGPVTDDPIVSSDAIGCRQSLLFDSLATIKAGQKIIKVLAWYESLGHACRVLRSGPSAVAGSMPSEVGR